MPMQKALSAVKAITQKGLTLIKGGQECSLTDSSENMKQHAPASTATSSRSIVGGEVQAKKRATGHSLEDFYYHPANKATSFDSEAAARRRSTGMRHPGPLPEFSFQEAVAVVVASPGFR